MKYRKAKYSKDLGFHKKGQIVEYMIARGGYEVVEKQKPDNLYHSLVHYTQEQFNEYLIDLNQERKEKLKILNDKS